LGGAGTINTAAIAYAGDDSSSNLANSELWNGTSWSNGQDMNTARDSLAFKGSGNSTAALAAGGLGPPEFAATEEWYGDGKVTDVIQSS